MKLAGIKPSVDHAAEFIRGHLNNGTWRTGEYLPPVRQLAKMSAVSTATMVKAIALLKNDGLLQVNERKRIRAGGQSHTGLPKDVNQKKWQRTRMQLERDIFTGRYSPLHGLPSLKELQAGYGVTFATMRKAVQALSADGVIVSRRRGYDLPQSQRQLDRQIVFVTCTGHLKFHSALNNEHHRFVDLVESECTRAGYQLKIVEIDFFDSLASGTPMIRQLDLESVQGFIVDVWWHETENVRTSYIEVLSQIIGRKKPVAILDELGNFTVPFETNPRVQVFTLEGVRAGERIARRLLGLGHRSIVYLSMVHEMAWSIDRFNGLQTQMVRGGCKPTDVHLVADAIDVLILYIYAASGLSDVEIRRLSAIDRSPRSPSQVEDNMKLWAEFKKRNRGSVETAPHDRDLQDHLRFLLNRSASDDYARELSMRTLVVAGSRIFSKLLNPVFEKALALPDVTAWVCANDDVAFEALSFLRNRNIKVPKRLSVVGFDNTPVKALEQRLTTFDFNALGFVSGILNFIARPPRPRGPFRHEAIQVEGMLLERATTGPAIAVLH